MITAGHLEQELIDGNEAVIEEMKEKLRNVGSEPSRYSGECQHDILFWRASIEVCREAIKRIEDGKEQEEV